MLERKLQCSGHVERKQDPERSGENKNQKKDEESEMITKLELE